MEKEPLILNIETSTDLCSVCISRGEEILGMQESDETYQHAEMLTLFIEKCAEQANVSLNEMDAVAISSGPGSYTSLRVGTSVAKGICYALDLPLIRVDTLQGMALARVTKQCVDGVYYCPMIDARRMEVYCAIFDGANKLVAETTAKIVDSDSFSSYFSTGKTIIFMGNGAPKCKEILESEQAIFDDLVCSASHMPALAVKSFRANKFEETAYYTPTYLKPPNITKPKTMRGLRKA